MNSTPLSVISRPLRDFAVALGQASPDWYREEGLHQIAFYEEGFSRDAVAALEIGDLLPMVQVYGEALDCDFLSGRRPVLRIDSNLGQESLDEFRRVTANTEVVVFRFALNKDRLLTGMIDDLPPHCRLFLFLYAQALDRNLRESPLQELEANLWGAPFRGKIILIVPDHQIWLDGEYLAVLGGERVDTWRSALPAEAPDTSALENVYETSQKLLKWQQPWLAHLTPLHLRISGEAAKDDPIASALRVGLTNLVILYTADQTVIRDRAWLSTFAGAQLRTEIELASARDKILEGDWQEQVDILYRLFEWAYHPEGSPEDRLDFIQIGIAQAMQGTEITERFQLLLVQAGNVEDNVRWHWKSFIEGDIEKFIGQIQQLEGFVSNTVRAYGGQTSELIKSLSETMLAAVAVLIGSFIVAVFKDPFNSTVFQIGLWVYAGYVAMFPLIYNMVNQWGRFRALEEDFNDRRKRYEGRLTVERVSKIIGGHIQISRSRYIRWYWVTIATYFLVIGLAILASFLLPAVLQ